jgi:hypothetical protein
MKNAMIKKIAFATLVLLLFVLLIMFIFSTKIGLFTEKACSRKIILASSNLNSSLSHANSINNIESEKAIIEQIIRSKIGWALTKDKDLAMNTLSQDEDLLIINPDSSITVGFQAQKRTVETVFMSDRFKATDFAIRDLRIGISRLGDAAWYFCYLDDHCLWDGRPVGWDNVRWTGVLEKRDGKWVVVQMHFSFPR